MVVLTSGGIGVTVAANQLAAGQSIVIYNNTANKQVISTTSGVTLRLAGEADESSTIEMDGYGLATLVCFQTNKFLILGGGLS